MIKNLWKHTENGTSILTGVGRIVSGDCLKPQTKDADGNPLVIKSGPNAGQPRSSFYIGLAIPKTDPSWPKIQAAILAEAKHGHPGLFDASGNCINPNFAFKFTDGDSKVPNSKGNVPSSKEGFPGHYVIHFSNGFAPSCHKEGQMGLEEVTDPNVIKRGYYAHVFGTVKPNASSQNPGVYINTSMIMMVKEGAEIFSGPSANDVFGSLNAAESVTPPAPPVTPVTPAPDFGNPVAPPPPPPPPPPAEKMYKVGDKILSHAQLIAAGWTEANITASAVLQ